MEQAKDLIFQYRTKSEVERASLSIVLESHGYKKADEEPKPFNEAPVIVINRDKKTYGYVAKGSKNNDDISVTNILGGIFTRPKKPIQCFRIYGYDVTVNPTDVSVGCQRLTFAQIDKLTEAVAKQRATE